MRWGPFCSLTIIANLPQARVTYSIIGVLLKLIKSAVFDTIMSYHKITKQILLHYWAGCSLINSENYGIFQNEWPDHDHFFCFYSFLPFPLAASLFSFFPFSSCFASVFLLAPFSFSGFESPFQTLFLDVFSALPFFYSQAAFLTFHSSSSVWNSFSSFSLYLGSMFSHAVLYRSTLLSLSLFAANHQPLYLKQAFCGRLGAPLLAYVLINQFKFIVILYQRQYKYHNRMKGFIISELLIYDPKRPSPKKKPIEIDIQEAKILAYFPQNVAIQQKCNTVGMAQGVFGFCHNLMTGKDSKDEEQSGRGQQFIFMDCCTLCLSEVEENIWIFVKLDHQLQSRYYRPGEPEQNSYLDQSFTQATCRIFMRHLYQNFRFFYGSIRGWVFKERFQQLQQILSAFVIRYQQIYKLDGRLDLLSYSMRDMRLIPLDVNSTLKFSYFKNVLQSYNQNIVHLVVYAYGVLAFSSLGKETTQFLSKYLFSTGEPYMFLDNHKNKMNVLGQIPKTSVSQKFGVIYNTKSIGFEQNVQNFRGSVSVSKMQGVDLLGLQSNRFQFFQVYIQEEQTPVKISFYNQNNMFLVSFYKQNPTINELVFQNRFFHDNSDKFIQKINQSLPSLIKPNDPYKFIFHNCATFTGKSTIKQWKSLGFQIMKTFQVLHSNAEGIVATSTQSGWWVYGIHRFSRILILLVPLDTQLNRVQEFVGKMTKQYFTRAYV